MIRWQTYAMATSLTFLGGLATSVAIGHQSASAAPESAAPEPAPAPFGPIAVPVTGTVTADQGGPWNVGILGTPTVNVANAPAVTISNSAAQPFFVRNVDDPGRTAYQSIQQLTPSSCTGFNGALVECQGAFTVPAGHRLVAQHLMGAVQFTSVPQVVTIDVQSPAGFPLAGTRLAPPLLTDTSFDLPVVFYIDGGQTGATFYVQAFVDPTTPFESNPNQPPATFVISGYVLDCSAGPCSAISQ